MNIQKTSWHYRLATVFSETPRGDLCSYCRMVVWSLVRLLLVAVFIAIVAFIFGTVGLSPLLWVADAVFNFLPASWYVTEGTNTLSEFEALAIIGASFYAIGAGCFVTTKVRDILRKRKYARSSDGYVHQPGIVETRWKDFKEKTCTLVEFVE